MTRCFIPSVNYKSSKVYRHRYKDRLPPQQCSVVRKGKQCGNYAVPGMLCCHTHGGAAAKKNLKHGSQSKSLKNNIMYFLNSLSRAEKNAIAKIDYSNDKIIETQLQLTDILLKRGLDYLQQLETELDEISERIANPEEGDNVPKLTVDRTYKEKSIAEGHKVVNMHQKKMDDLVGLREKLRKDVSATDTLNRLAQGIAENPVEMLAELMQSCISAGYFEDINDLKLLVENKETIDVELYKYEDDTD